jgi:hypothetical protein
MNDHYAVTVEAKVLHATIDADLDQAMEYLDDWSRGELERFADSLEDLAERCREKAAR